MGITVGNRPAPNALIVIFWMLFGIGFPLFFFYAKLITEVCNDGVYIQFFPFHWTFRKIAFREIIRYDTRIYNPILEYGGWGIRKGYRGMAYTVSGNKGLQLELFNNRRLLIGSKRPEELFHAIHIKFNEQKANMTTPNTRSG